MRNASFLVCRSLANVIFYLPLHFLPCCPIHSDHGPDWILVSLYWHQKEKRGCSILQARLRKLQSVYTKWSYFRYVQVERNCCFFSPSPISWLVRFRIKCWCHYSVTAGSEHGCKKPGSSDVTPSSFHLVSAAPPEVFHPFKTIMKPSYGRVCNCSHKCSILFWCRLISWFQGYDRTVHQSIIALCVFPFIVLHLLPLCSPEDINENNDGKQECLT